MRLQVRSLALLSGLRIWPCPELWCRPAATALIRPLVWEPLSATGEALEKAKRPKKKKKKRNGEKIQRKEQIIFVRRLCAEAIFSCLNP